MTPEVAMSYVTKGLQMALFLGAPLLISVLIVGVLVGIVQAATSVNEPTVAFVAKGAALMGVLMLGGHFLLGRIVAYTTELFQQIPHIVG
jgi:flagellar biosynthesis protein FliQ